VGGTMRHIGELAGFAAIGGEKPDLRFAFAALLGVFFAYLCRFALTVGDEGEPAPVGRPGRAVGVGAAAGEALCFTTAGGDDPDGGVVGVFTFVDGGDYEGYTLTIQ